MPRQKKMKNNASSATKEKELLDIINNEENSLVSKHNQLRSHYLTTNPMGESKGVDDQYLKSSVNILPSEIKKNQRQFTINNEVAKMFTKSNFPARFPQKLDIENSFANVIIQENGETLTPISPENVKMTKLFINFWNKLITKQDSITRSYLDHRLTDFEAGYFPCQLRSLFNSPESYVKKTYCEKSRYSGPGYELLPSSHNFSKISSRSTAKLEIQQIFDFYFNSENHFFLIPIEMSSKLSRAMFRANEMAQKTHGCNKIFFNCQPSQNFTEDCHPLFNNEYKSSIELENLPSNGMSLFEHYQRNENSELNSNFLKTFFSYPFLSHFLCRSDFWIDDFYSRCWHYSRYFCDKLNLGNKINATSNILIKDSFFKYLLACSARICVAIKYWVLNPEGATYFRCWCGSKIYDSKQESKVLTKHSIGSSELYNLQLKIKTQDIYHRKHEIKKMSHHICACNQQFNDHKLWISHIFSTKISEMNKICPIFIYMYAQNSLHDSHYVCECAQSFSDYDFWSFWLHSCNCSTLKQSIKNQCCCNSDNGNKTSTNGVKTQRRNKSVKKGRMSKRSRSIDKRKKIKRNLSEVERSNDVEDSSLVEVDKYNKTDEEDKWRDGDKSDESVKVSKQNNFNNYKSILPLKRRRAK